MVRESSQQVMNKEVQESPKSGVCRFLWVLTHHLSVPHAEGWIFTVQASVSELPSGYQSR